MTQTIRFAANRNQIHCAALEKIGFSKELSGIYPVGVGGKNQKGIPRLDPTTQQPILDIENASWDQINGVIERSGSAQKRWASLSGEKRVQIIMEVEKALKNHVDALAAILSMDVGKSHSEARGEIVEVEDVFKLIYERVEEVGGKNSFKQIKYKSMEEARDQAGWYRLLTYKPLGIICITTAFNFPFAVFGWGSFPALASGNSVILKAPKDSAVISFAMVKVISDTLAKYDFADLVSVVATDRINATKLWQDDRIKMVQATGSEGMGQKLVDAVGHCFKRTIFELGGNNAVIVHGDANIDLAVDGCLFGAAGTTGQRCTTVRRIYIHKETYAAFKTKLVQRYKKDLRIGDPLQSDVNVGPLIHTGALDVYRKTLKEIQEQGGKILTGGREINGLFVEPTIVEPNKMQFEVSYHERFVPIVYLFCYDTLEEVINEINKPGYGLSGGMYTYNEAAYTYCLMNIRVGIFNWNYSSSGAEANGFFGGEGKTGGCRMLGTQPNDALFNHYRYVTETVVNPTKHLIHAQGVEF